MYTYTFECNLNFKMHWVREIKYEVFDVKISLTREQQNIKGYRDNAH